MPPTYKLVTESAVTPEIAAAYDNIVGKTDEEKKAYYTKVLQLVLSSMYYSSVDAKQQPVPLVKMYFGPYGLCWGCCLCFG